MKLGFVTCVQLGLSCMQAIYEAGAKLSLAITLPDDKAVDKSGRVFLDDFCEKNLIPLVKSSHVNDQAVIDAIKEADIDWLFIIGWSQIAGSALLVAPKCGVLGAHPTLLPIGRGRAAIPWAILKGLDQTGVTLFKLDEGVDTGKIAAQQVVEMNVSETATSLYSKIDVAHVNIIRDFVPRLLRDDITLTTQDDTQATIWPGRKPEDGKIDLFGSVWGADRLIRAVTHPYPGAFYYVGDTKVIVWKGSVLHERPNVETFIEFSDGYLLLEEYEIAG